MLSHTLEAPETITPNIINQTVNERGFFLYEWISPEELRMTLDRDYLIIVRWASIPLAVITGIAGLIGFSG
jgi:restriction endonuclease S subunit